VENALFVICLWLLIAANSRGHRRMLGLRMARLMGNAVFFYLYFILFQHRESRVCALNLRPYGITRQSLVVISGGCAIWLRLIFAACSYGHCRMLFIYIAAALLSHHTYILFCFSIGKVEFAH
jgi:hypothetical protein